MKPKSFISIVLFVFITGSLVFFGFKEYGRKNPGGSGEPAVAVTVKQPREKVFSGGADGKTSYNKVIAYFFHGNLRCRSCRLIEDYAHEALAERFPGELENGLIEWRVVNIQEPGNKHFMNDYNLSFWSLILVDTRGGREMRWKNCEKVWDLLNDPKAFAAYVQMEVRAYLEEG